MAPFGYEAWHPRKLAFLTSAAFILSVTSTLDCEFINIMVGFNPENSLFDGTNTGIGVGLWTYRSPINSDECILYSVASRKNLLSNDKSYETLMFNEDFNWGVSRLSAALTAIFGFISAVSKCFVKEVFLFKSLIITCLNTIKFHHAR